MMSQINKNIGEKPSLAALMKQSVAARSKKNAFKVQTFKLSETKAMYGTWTLPKYRPHDNIYHVATSYPMGMNCKPMRNHGLTQAIMCQAIQGLVIPVDVSLHWSDAEKLCKFNNIEIYATELEPKITHVEVGMIGNYIDMYASYIVNRELDYRTSSTPMARLPSFGDAIDHLMKTDEIFGFLLEMKPRITIRVNTYDQLDYKIGVPNEEVKASVSVTQFGLVGTPVNRAKTEGTTFNMAKKQKALAQTYKNLVNGNLLATSGPLYELMLKFGQKRYAAIRLPRGQASRYSAIHDLIYGNFVTAYAWLSAVNTRLPPLDQCWNYDFYSSITPGVEQSPTMLGDAFGVNSLRESVDEHFGPHGGIIKEIKKSQDVVMQAANITRAGLADVSSSMRSAEAAAKDGVKKMEDTVASVMAPLKVISDFIGKFDGDLTLDKVINIFFDLLLLRSTRSNVVRTMVLGRMATSIGGVTMFKKLLSWMSEKFEHDQSPTDDDDEGESWMSLIMGMAMKPFQLLRQLWFASCGFLSGFDIKMVPTITKGWAMISKLFKGLHNAAQGLEAILRLKNVLGKFVNYLKAFSNKHFKTKFLCIDVEKATADAYKLCQSILRLTSPTLVRVVVSNPTLRRKFMDIIDAAKKLAVSPVAMQVPNIRASIEIAMKYTVTSRLRLRISEEMDRPKFVPYTLMLVGKPGIGKTTFINKFREHVSKTLKVQNTAYEATFDALFSDPCTGHETFFITNDPFRSTSAQNPLVSQLMDIVGPNAVLMNTAMNELRPTTNFCPIVLATSNEPYALVDGHRHPAAIDRRFNKYEMELKNIPDLFDEATGHINPEVAAANNWNVYTFKKMKVTENAQPVNEPAIVDLSEFLNKITKEINVHLRKERLRRDNDAAYVGYTEIVKRELQKFVDGTEDVPTITRAHIEEATALAWDSESILERIINQYPTEQQIPTMDETPEARRAAARLAAEARLNHIEVADEPDDEIVDHGEEENGEQQQEQGQQIMLNNLQEEAPPPALRQVPNPNANAPPAQFPNGNRQPNTPPQNNNDDDEDDELAMVVEMSMDEVDRAVDTFRRNLVERNTNIAQRRRTIRLRLADMDYANSLMSTKREHGTQDYTLGFDAPNEKVWHDSQLMVMTMEDGRVFEHNGKRLTFTYDWVDAIRLVDGKWVLYEKPVGGNVVDQISYQWYKNHGPNHFPALVDGNLRLMHNQWFALNDVERAHFYILFEASRKVRDSPIAIRETRTVKELLKDAKDTMKNWFKLDNLGHFLTKFIALSLAVAGVTIVMTIISDIAEHGWHAGVAMNNPWVCLATGETSQYVNRPVRAANNVKKVVRKITGQAPTIETTSNISDVENKLNDCLYSATVMSPVGGNFNMIGLCDNFYLLPAHVFTNRPDKDGYYQLGIKPRGIIDHPKGSYWTTYHIPKEDIIRVPHRDLAIMRIEGRCMQKNILRHLAEEVLDPDDEPRVVSAAYHNGILTRWPSNIFGQDEEYSLHCRFTTMQLRNGYLSRTRQPHGSSGGYTLNLDSKAGGKLIGVLSSVGDSYGVVTPIVRSEIEKVIAQFKVCVPKISVDQVPTDCDFPIIAETPSAVVVPGKTSLKKTPFNGIMGDSGAVPVLAHTKGDKLLDGREKCYRPGISQLEPKLLDETVNELGIHLAYGIAREYGRLPKICDFEHAVKGDYIRGKPMDLSTSPGKGKGRWDENRKKPGKRDHIDINDEGVLEYLSPKLIEITQRQIRSHLEGEVTPTAYAQFPKDELRPPGKKPRSIDGSPLEDILEYRCLNGEMDAMINGLRKDYSMVAVGINLNSPEGSDIAEVLMDPDNKVINLDQGAWDRRPTIQLWRAAAKVANLIMMDGFDTARVTLAEQTVNAPIISGKYIIQPCVGMRSGYPGTANTNTIIHLLVLIYVIKRIMKKATGLNVTLQDIRQNMFILAYADDIIMAVYGQSTWTEHIDGAVIASAFDDLGFEVTNPRDKTLAVDRVCDKEHLDFLKHVPTYSDDLNRWLWKPHMSVIQNALNWYSGDDPYESIESTMHHVYPHGRELYEHIRKTLNRETAPEGHIYDVDYDQMTKAWALAEPDLYRPIRMTDDDYLYNHWEE